MTPRLLRKYDPWHSWNGKCRYLDTVRESVFGTIALHMDEATDTELLLPHRLRSISLLAFLPAAIGFVVTLKSYLGRRTLGS
jgi:hypothetical protein